MDGSDELNDSFDRLLLDSDVDSTDNGSDGDAVLPNGGIFSNFDSDDDSESSEDEEEEDRDSSVWTSSIRQMNDLPFVDDDCGWNHEAATASTPLECYSLFVDEILDHVVQETNRYGSEKSQNWKETDKAEIRTFVGLCLKMGYVKLPELRNYWCRSGDFGDTPVCSECMTRPRFEEILRNIHLNDNSQSTNNDRLHKIRPVIELFNSASGRLFRPMRDVCIDESLVPFRGRLVFRQYVPNKRHRYGIKVFKVCAQGGYTWRIQVYAGKDPARQGSVADSVVMNLMEGLLDEGMTLYTDNWYTSVNLAENMLTAPQIWNNQTKQSGYTERGQEQEVEARRNDRHAEQ